MPHLIDLSPDEETARLVVDVIHALARSRPEHVCAECGEPTDDAVIWITGDDGCYLCRACMATHEAAWMLSWGDEEQGRS